MISQLNSETIVKQSETIVKQSVTIIRHGESEYNVAYKNNIDDVNVMFNPTYLDSLLTFNGDAQCKKTAKLLANKDVSIVFTSPLRRCLLTTRHIFANHKSKPKIVVFPSLMERIEDAGDCPVHYSVLKSQFPEYDFSILDTYPDPSIWFAHELCTNEKNIVHYGINENVKKLVSELNNPGNNKLTTTLDCYDSNKIIQFIKNLYPIPIESSFQLKSRINRSIHSIKQHVKDYNILGNICIVGHSQYFYHMTSTLFDNNLKPLNGIKLNNAEFVDVLL